MGDNKKSDGFSRRDLIKGVAAGAAMTAGAGIIAAAPRYAAAKRFGHDDDRGRGYGRGHGHDHRRGGGELALVNGTFVDGSGIVANAITIKNGRISNVGQALALGPDAQVINLKGRTVVPGLYDSHVHYARAAVRPGHSARRVERALSILELQETIADRAATVPPGEFITCVGGWNHLQFAENRRPTKAELDEAAPNHPVYISATGGGTGAIANSLAELFFENNGVDVDDAGIVSSANDALAALEAVQTEADKLRGWADMNAHSNSLGLTAVINAGNFSDLEYALQLWRQDELTIRVRTLYDADGGPAAVEERIRNNFSQGGRAVGDDLFRPSGFGERVGASATMNPDLEATAHVIAQGGWTLVQHSISDAENNFHVNVFQNVNAITPIDGLRWVIIHVNEVSAANLLALKDMGAGVLGQTWRYLSTVQNAGPPWRRIVDSGVPLGGGTDSTNVSAFDPWLALYYITTGRNLAGTLINDGQQLTRIEGLRIYTEGSAYAAYDEQNMGSFTEGKYADLAVLSEDYLTVPEDRLRRIESVLTLLGGDIVHASGPFADLLD